MLPRLFLITLILMTPATSPEELDRLIDEGNSLEELLAVETTIREAMKSAPSADWAWRWARVNFRLGDLATGDVDRENYFRKCLELADRALELDPRSAHGYFFRGVCRGKLGEVHGIWSSLNALGPFERDMTKAIQLGPSIDHGGPHRALGRYYFELPGILGGNLEKSIAHLEKAVDYGPSYGENYLFLAESLYKKHDFLAAKDTVLRLFEVIRRQPEARDARELESKGRELLKHINLWIEARNSDAQGTQN